MRASPGQLDAAREELAQLEADDPFAAHEAANQKVAACAAAYNARKAAIEESGVVAVRPNPINGLPMVVGPLRGLRAALDAAFAERRQAEERCRRVSSLRSFLELGSTHAPFVCTDLPKLTPSEAVARGGRALVVDKATNRLVYERSDRAPVPVGKAAWQAEKAARRAAGDQREAERRSTIEANRRRRQGHD